MKAILRSLGAVAAVGSLLACALLFNLAMLPYAPWFKVAMLLACPFACWTGLRLGQARVPAGGS